MLAVFDRLRQKKKEKQEMVYFYTRSSFLENITEQLRTSCIYEILEPFQNDKVDLKLSLNADELEQSLKVDSTSTRQTLEMVRDSLMDRKQYNIPYTLA